MKAFITDYLDDDEIVEFRVRNAWAAEILYFALGLAVCLNFGLCGLFIVAIGVMNALFSEVYATNKRLFIRRWYCFFNPKTIELKDVQTSTSISYGYYFALGIEEVYITDFNGCIKCIGVFKSSCNLSKQILRKLGDFN